MLQATGGAACRPTPPRVFGLVWGLTPARSALPGPPESPPQGRGHRPPLPAEPQGRWLPLSALRGLSSAQYKIPMICSKAASPGELQGMRHRELKTPQHRAQSLAPTSMFNKPETNPLPSLPGATRRPQLPQHTLNLCLVPPAGQPLAPSPQLKHSHCLPFPQEQEEAAPTQV